MTEFSDFHDVQFPLTVAFGATGGPERRNEIVSLTSGREKRNAWIRAMSNSKTLDEATREMFGLTFDELDAQWRESLKPATAGAPKAKDEPPPDPHE